MPFFEISLETANKIYLWGWRASIAGAMITAVGVILLMYGTRVRDRDTESQLSRAHREVAVAQSAAQSARDELAKIKEQNIDRNIPGNIKSEIVTLLREAGPHMVEVGYDGNGDDAEQVRFAEKIRGIFVDAGWNPPPIGAGRIDLTRPALIGVHFYCKNPREHIPDYFKPLFKLFDKARLIKEQVLNYADYLPNNDSLLVLAGRDPKK
jgi:hypothetical protein